MSNYTLYLGDCLEVMPGIPSDSVDFIFTDPPYPYIKREYGYWTEETWFPMMREVVRQSRRILKPHGSMVMVLQPNSEKVGKMRLWLWRFMVWCGEEWGIVQDAYWWNFTILPAGGATTKNLMRASIKPCLWLGDPECYRNQSEVLWTEGDHHFSLKAAARHDRVYKPSGHSTDYTKMLTTFRERGGVTPFNLLPIANNNQKGDDAGANGHGAGTPLKLTDWWLRYLSKPGDTVLDPFNGSGTTGVAALKLGRKYIGIEKIEKYYQVSQERIGQAEREMKEAQIARERQPYLMAEVTR